jgi:D-sedoheptulose 7-phosphate isomerase
MNINEIITASLKESQSTLEKIYNNDQFISSIEKASECLIDTYKSNGKILLAGNGGSAADCQHICAELVGRLNFDRKPLSAIALTTNSSNLTCISNDYGYDHVFVRQMEALALSHDSLIVYTTSGTSKNILSLIEQARKKLKYIISLTGHNTQQLQKYSDVVISVDSKKTTRIQEIHAIVGHILCECVEEKLFENSK